MGETSSTLLALVDPKEDRLFLDTMLSKHRKAVQDLNVYVEHVGKRRPMRPEPVAAALNEIAASEAIFTADTGMCNVWSFALHRCDKGAARDRFVLARLHGQCFATGHRGAIALSGLSSDCHGGRRRLGHTIIMGDLRTVAQYNLPIKIVVLDNGALGMVKLEMEVAGIPDWQTDLKNPNFARVAEAISIKGIRIKNLADLHSGLEQALDYPGPALG